MSTLHKKHRSLKVYVEIVLQWEMLLFIELYVMNVLENSTLKLSIIPIFSNNPNIHMLKLLQIT